MQKLVTQTEFGVIYGNATRGKPVTKQAVRKIIQRLNIPKHLGTKIDPEEAMKIIAQHANPARLAVQSAVALTENYTYTPPPKAAPAETAVDDADEPAEAKDGFAEFRTQREKANAQMADLQLQREMGRLVDRDEVERHTANLFRELRDKVLAAPYRFAGRVVTLATEREVVACVEEDLNSVFAEFAASIAPAEGRPHAG